MTPYYEHAGITIYHGDSFDVLPTLSGVGAVVTDPPYSSGGAFRGDRMGSIVAKYVQSSTASYRPEFAGDNRDQRSFAAWCTLWMNCARQATTEGGVLVSFIDWRQLPIITDAVQSGGWTWRGVAVWSKKFGRPRPGGFSSACEFVVWGSNGPLSESGLYPPGVFECQTTPNADREHVAQKPESVMRWALGVVPPGALVLDPFMGSGTTLKAAKEYGCPAIGIDSDERYCEIAARRLAQEVMFA